MRHPRGVKTLARLVATLSQRWWAIVLLGALIALMARRLIELSARMRLLTGHAVFDLQGALGIDGMRAQLAHYTPEAVRLYGRFSSIDFFFPFLNALFWAALAAWGLRRARPALFATGAWQRWLPWAFVGCVFDWIENVTNAWLIGRYPPLHEGVAGVALVARNGRIVAVSALAVLALAFALWGAATSIARFVNRRAT